MFNVEIINTETSDTRVVEMDAAGYEYGRDLTGRVCRIAKHSITPSCMPSDGYVTTSGNKYKRKEG